MKKRILSIILILCMVIGLMPLTAAAEEEAYWENKIWIGDIPVNRKTDGTDTWVFVPLSNILILNDNFSEFVASKLTDSNDEAYIRIEGLDNLTIRLSGKATVGVPGMEWISPESDRGVKTYGIYAPDTNLSIEDPGTLNVYGNANAIWCKSLNITESTVNCTSYATAIRVMDSSAYLDKTQTGDMLVQSSAAVTAKTTEGRGIYPELWHSTGTGYDYRDEGGAAVLVSGSLTVEDSTVNADNTCYSLPDVTEGYSMRPQYFYRNSFCTSILVLNDLTVSGSDASVTGKFKNKATEFGSLDPGMRTRLASVAAGKMFVKEGGTIEGFVTNSENADVTQGLRRVQLSEVRNLKNALISLSGEGVIRNGIANGSVETEAPEFSNDGGYVFKENFSPTDEYGSHREITIFKPSAVYLRKTESGQEMAFDSDFLRTYSVDGTTIDLRDLSGSVFVKNGWQPDWGIPKIYVKSGDWTLLPATDSALDCDLEKGSLTVQYENGQHYVGGSACVGFDAVLNIQGDGIINNWDIKAYPPAVDGISSGTVRFISGTVKQAKSELRNQVYILGGNIHFTPKEGQVVKNGDGKILYPLYYYFENPDSDKVTSIAAPGRMIDCEDEYYYPISYETVANYNNLVVWSLNDLDIYYASAETAEGEQYRLLRVPGGNGKLERAVPSYKLAENPNTRFYRNPEGSVTLSAGKIDVYENWGTIDDPRVVETLTELNSNMTAEWSYENENGEKIVVGGSSLTCEINDLSGITDYRTYTCEVYYKNADGSKSSIGSYSAKVYVMRWEEKDAVYAAPGDQVTFTVNPSEETKWAAGGFFDNMKWQVDKGAGWEDIPDSKSDSYTVEITEENAGYKYRRVVSHYYIGNFDKHESSIYVEFESPELSVIIAPEITSQPQGIRIQEQDTSVYEMGVSANNAESYKWQKKVDDTFVDIEGADSDTLEVGAGDVGTYRCVVSNRYGNTISKEAAVSTRPAPTCGTLNGANKTVGEKIELAVGISNAPEEAGVSVKWQYSADDGATWVDVVSIDEADNIHMNVTSLEFSETHYPEGTVIKRSEIISSLLTILKATADMDGWKVRCVLTDAVGSYYSNIAELSIDLPDYTVSFDTDGGTEIASKTEVQWEDKVLDGITDPTKDGWKFAGWKYGEAEVTPQTTYSELASDANVLSIELKAQWEDAAGPAGEISVGENIWNGFSDRISFELFFNSAQTAAITASDNSGDPVTISYLLSDKSLSEDELDGKEFTAYTGGFEITPDNKCIIYARLTDKAGNITYLSSDGIVLDNSAPVISGVENGETYCGAQTVTVEEEYIDSVTVNGTKVQLDANNQFTLSAGTHKIVATDKSGNASAEITVTVNDGHTYEWQSENGKYWKKCKICGDETSKKDIPVMTIDAPDKVCRTQDCLISALPAENVSVIEIGYEFISKGGPLNLNVVDGRYQGVLSTELYAQDEDSFTLVLYATTTDGFKFSVSKNVEIQNEHSGGGATCSTPAVCDTCGEIYGQPDSTKHNLEKTARKAATVLETGNSEYWHCKDCGKYFTDENGENETEYADIIIPKLPPEIIKGRGQLAKAGKKKELSFTSNAAFGDFIRVEINGKTLEEKNYTVKEGSTIVTLEAEYVAGLPIGDYGISIVSEGGTASTIFTVYSEASPGGDSNGNSSGNTAGNSNGSTNGGSSGNSKYVDSGDNTPMALWIALIAVSGVLVTVSGVHIKRKRNKF
ncbi:MAG: InlB B-repeat-containing protein [Lachnospiraceae bacterium]|jgi:hypothetical protein